MLDTAIKLAMKSKFKQRMGAVLVNGGRVISCGINTTTKTNPKNRFWENSCHAEESAIRQRLRYSKKTSALEGATLYVARIKPGGSTGLAKPCASCEALIRQVGIRKVIYTTNCSTPGVYHL